MKTKLLSREEQQAIINERDLLFLSMSSLVSGNVEWFRGSCGYSVGLCRENAPCGGIVLIKYDGAFVGSHYFEQWAPLARRTAELIQSEDSIALRTLADRLASVIRLRQSPFKAAV